MKFDKNHKPAKFTARELLVSAAGPEHALHTVVAVREEKQKSLCFKCSCGAMCFVLPTDVNKAALRNVGVALKIAGE